MLIPSRWEQNKKQWHSFFFSVFWGPIHILCNSVIDVVAIFTFPFTYFVIVSLMLWPFLLSTPHGFPLGQQNNDRLGSILNFGHHMCTYDICRILCKRVSSIPMMKHRGNCGMHMFVTFGVCRHCLAYCC